jgi:hypothetical protein
MNKPTRAARLYALHLVFTAVENPSVMLEHTVLVYAATDLQAEDRAAALGRSLAKRRSNVPALQGSSWIYTGVRKVTLCELICDDSQEAILATSFSLQVDEPEQIAEALEGGFARGVLDW